MDDRKAPTLETEVPCGAGMPGSEPTPEPGPRERCSRKVEEIEEACRAGDREAVVELASSENGLVCDEVRGKACV